MIRLQRLFAHDFKQLREIDLHFPDAGRILVQGKNEAGKSTLFESIFFALFGQALATESVGRQSLDDLIGYEKNKARVELDLASRDRVFRITRTLNRGKPNVWELEIVKGDLVEEIKGNRAVNDRLVTELGFDGEALLNTCFVEQKKLEKLEGMNKTKREESLSKLLNLEKLLDLEESLRLRGDDEKMVSRLSNRVELAQAHHDLPQAEADLTKTEGQLKLIELRTQVARAHDEKRAAMALQDQLIAFKSRRDGLRSAVAKVDALDKGRRSMGNALDRFDLLAQQNKSLDDLRRQRQEMQNAARDTMPELESRIRLLGRLARNLARLQRFQDARTSAMIQLRNNQAVQLELKEQLDRAAGLDSSIAEHEARAARLETLLHDYDVGEALGAWATVALEAGADVIASKALDDLARNREQALARLRVGLIASGVMILLLIAATALVPLGVYYVARNSLLVLVILAAALVLDAIAVALLTLRAIGLGRDLEGATTLFGKAQGENATRREIDSGRAGRLSTAAARLVELGAAVPLSPEAAQAQRIEIAGKLENKTRTELGEQRESVLESLNYARAQRDEVEKRVEQIQVDAPDDRIARCRRIAERTDAAINRWQPLLAGRAADLHIEPDLQAARDAKRDAESEFKTWQGRIKQAEKVGAQIGEGEARARKMSDELRVAYESARNLLEAESASWNEALDRTAYVTVGRKLSEAFDAHGGEQVRSALNSAEKEIGACERELKLREQAAQEAVDLARQVLVVLGIADPLGVQVSVNELDAFDSQLKNAPVEERARLEARVRSLHMRVGALRETRDRLERELGLAGEGIDLEEALLELSRERREQEERKYAAEIVLRTRKRIVHKILPATMDYMRRILPQLTRDRYHDSDLDPETYKIKVWDERAGQSGAWKEKNIFSGGTKDQFSLALRLAFALATLPQERGTSPGFIFLDEPLGSFDDERAAALLYLLTEGEIARAFDQIFLISHVRVQEDRFTHQIRLENGVVVESSL